MQTNLKLLEKDPICGYYNYKQKLKKKKKIKKQK